MGSRTWTGSAELAANPSTILADHMAKLLPFTDAEFADFIAEPKELTGDVSWAWQANRDYTARFAPPLVLRWRNHELVINGTYNATLESLTFVVLNHRLGKNARIYGLCHGGDTHLNPDGQILGRLHKHRWSQRHRCKDAYVPTDIVSPPTDPEGVWQEFCAEALFQHVGVFHPLPDRQVVLL